MPHSRLTQHGARSSTCFGGGVRGWRLPIRPPQPAAGTCSAFKIFEACNTALLAHWRHATRTARAGQPFSALLDTRAHAAARWRHGQLPGEAGSGLRRRGGWVRRTRGRASGVGWGRWARACTSVRSLRAAPWAFSLSRCPRCPLLASALLTIGHISPCAPSTSASAPTVLRTHTRPSAMDQPPAPSRHVPECPAHDLASSCYACHDRGPFPCPERLARQDIPSAARPSNLTGKRS